MSRLFISSFVSIYRKIVFKLSFVNINSFSLVLPQTSNAPSLVLSDGAFMIYSRRRPTFPHSYPCSIIGPEGLNFRVRDGNGCDPLGIATEKSFRLVKSPSAALRSVFIIAAYVTIRLTLRTSQALHSGLFTLPPSAGFPQRPFLPLSVSNCICGLV